MIAWAAAGPSTAAKICLRRRALSRAAPLASRSCAAAVIAGVPAAFCAISRAAPWFCANVTFASCSDWSGMPTKGTPAASAVCTLPWRPR
jgi:hypothetical protein